MPQLQAAAADDSMAEAMLDAGLQQLSAKPPRLYRRPLYLAAENHRQQPRAELAKQEPPARKTGQAPATARWSKTPVRWPTQSSPTPCAGSARMPRPRPRSRKCSLLYPNEKSVRTLVFLADFHRRAGHDEAFKAALREAMKLDPSRRRFPAPARQPAERDRPG